MSRPRLWLLVLILFALAVRLIGINWDQGHHYHPDERAIVDAVGRLSLDPRHPQLNPKFFAYGSLPFYVMRAATDAVTVVWPAARSYDNLLLVGRGVSAVIGTLTVVLTVALGARLYSLPIGLLAGFFLAASPLHIQNSHFATTDIFLTLTVLFALYCLVRLVQRGRAYDYALAGIGIGFALATKFSAAPLFAPFGVALLVRLYRERNLLLVMGGALLGLLGVFAAFFVGQPYAVLDFNEYYKDVFEQSLMVRTAGLFPYTHQYIGAPKYGYEIAHIILFGMAPALGLVAVWATARRILGIIRARAEDLVLLAWVVPFFLVTGWFEVKFVRYLLPIYPVMSVWAAAWLRAAPLSRLRQLLTWVVVGASVLADLAFLSIYTRPHTVVAASEWVYRHIPADSTILTQHWDEGFPFSLPGYRSQRYTVTELPYYEHDNASKMREISRELANADYLAFQTKRLYGSLTRAAAKYPLTNKYFYLLFAGDLGYTLVYDHASRPGLLGLEFPDELIDESISVYDHPKVLIFQNTGHLSEDEIFDKIMNGYPSTQLSRTDLLLARAGSDGVTGGAGETTWVRSSWLALLWFVAVVEILGLCGYGIVYLFVPVSGSYALAKVLGVLLFAYIPWLLTGFGQVEFSRGTLAATLVLLAVVGVVARRRWPAKPARGEWWPTEILFWGAFAFFLAVRAFNPEVYWGEKPMDFAFLNALTRSTQLPPPEPWFAGSALHYSYFGQYVVAALGKLCAIHPGLTFNLGIGLTAGLTTAAAFALGCALSDRWRVGILAAVFTTLLGNLAGLRELVERRQMNFDYFWATSRVIKDTINEYPFWSFLFADLHAHMLVMPFSVAFVTLAIWWVRRDELHRHVRWPAILVLLGLTLGAIMVTNTWSSFTYLPFLPFLLGVVFLTRRHGGVLRFLIGIVTQVIAPILAVGALAVVLYLPYWSTWSAPERNWGWEHDSFVGLYDYANIFGLFLFILVPYLFLSWRRQLLPAHGDRLGWARSLPVWIVAIGVGVSLFVSVRTGLVMLAVLALHLALDRSTTPRHRLVFILTSFAFAVTAGCDFIHVWDRMNTIFKFYLEAWFLFAAAAAAAAYELWRGAIRMRPVRYAWRAGLLVLLALAAFTAGSATYGIINTNRVRTPRPTLDGTAYLPLRDAHEAAAFEWLNQTIGGIPVVAEAYGPSYQDYARVSMNTGLPTVLGWDYHVFQRAHSWADINRRKADLEKLYTTDNKDAARAILNKYHVALVYVGPQERKRYSGGNMPRFREWTDLLTPVYQNAGVTIFGVTGQFTTQRVLTIEEVPSEEGGEEEAPPPSSPGQLRQPRGVAVNSKGDAYVADFDNHRIQVFNKDLDVVKVIGERGDLPGQFKQPCGVAIGDDDTVYVADTWNQRVQILNPEGAYQREFGGPFYGPRGIAVSGDGRVYLADTGNHRVRRFNTAGKEDRSWGGLGGEPGQFKEPIGLTTDDEGRVYVCDNGNGRMQIFDADGKLETTFPVDGWESKVFSEPYVTLGPDGAIWVTVPLKKVVRAYDRDGNVLHEIGDKDGDKTLFRMPIGIAYDQTTNELVITDLENAVTRVAVPEEETRD